MLTAPAGSPEFGSPNGKPIEIRTTDGRTVQSTPILLSTYGKKLPNVRYRLALPRGRSLKSIDTVVIAIPPSGSAPLFAPDACAKRGMGSAAIQGATSNKWATLASMAFAVARDLQRVNPDLRFVFAGFSAGGFAAHLTEIVTADDCVGIIQVGSYPTSGSVPQTSGLPIVSLVGQSDFNLSQAREAVARYQSYGVNVKLLIHAGGHTWATAKDQERALDALGAFPKRTKVAGDSPMTTERQRDVISMLGKPMEEFHRVFGKPTRVDEIKMTTGELVGINQTWGRDWNTAMTCQWDDGMHVFMYLPAKGDWRAALTAYGLNPTGVRAVKTQLGLAEGFQLYGIQGIPSDWKCAWEQGHIGFARDANKETRRRLGLLSDELRPTGLVKDVPKESQSVAPTTSETASRIPIASDRLELEVRNGADAKLEVVGDTLRATTLRKGPNPWDAQVRFPVGSLENGRRYTVEFEAKADEDCRISLYGQTAEAPYSPTGLVEEVAVGKEYRKYRFEFVAKNGGAGPLFPVKFFIGHRLGTLWIRALSFDSGADELPPGVIAPYAWGQRAIPVSGQGGAGTETVDQAIVAAMREHGIVGCSVAVLRGSDVIYAKGFGFAELPDRTFLPTTTTRCGSIAKPITALCAMLLMDQGRLQRDEPVLPILRAAGFHISPIDTRMERITVRNLMDHTSGIPKGATYTSWRPGKDLISLLHLKRRPTAKDVVEHAWSTTRLAFDPGTKYSYSNTGFVTLARVVEAKAGMPFGEYLAKVAMPRFGIRNGEVHLSRDQLSPQDPARGKNEAAYYQTSEERYGSFLPEDAARGKVFGEAYRGMSSECSDGAGGIAASALGLAQLLSTLQSSSNPLSQQSIAAVLTPPSHYNQEAGFDPKRSQFMSQGFNVRYIGGRAWLSHGGMTNHCGGTIGYNAGYQFVVLSNWNAPSAPYVDSILGAVVAEAVTKIRR